MRAWEILLLVDLPRLPTLNQAANPGFTLVGSFFNHPIGRKNAAYIPGTVLAFVWGYIIPMYLLREPE